MVMVLCVYTFLSKLISYLGKTVLNAPLLTWCLIIKGSTELPAHMLEEKLKSGRFFA